MSKLEYTRAQWASCSDEGDDIVGKRIWTGIRRELSRRRLRSRAAWFAACTALAAASVAIGVVFGRKSVPVMEPVTVTHLSSTIASTDSESLLPDGTKVWLESGSSISYEDNFQSDRKVVLKGNASLDVVKTEDLSHFIVTAGDTFVEVHGTSFSVQQNNPEEVVVTLYEGAVDFVAPSGRVSLEKDNTLTYNRSRESVTTQPFFKDITWCGGAFKLQNASLKELVDFIRWKYNVEVYVSSSVNQKDIKLTGLVGHDESVDSVVDKVCYVMGLDCSREGRAYRFSKTK